MVNKSSYFKRRIIALVKLNQPISIYSLHKKLSEEKTICLTYANVHFVVKEMERRGFIKSELKMVKDIKGVERKHRLLYYCRGYT